MANTENLKPWSHGHLQILPKTGRMPANALNSLSFGEDKQKLSVRSGGPFGGL
jgi:hypothetical protein